MERLRVGSRASGPRRRAPRALAVVVSIALALVLAPATTPGAVAADPPAASGFKVVTAWSGLEYPTTVQFAPDGRVFVAEKPGRVLTYTDVNDQSATVTIDLRTQVFAGWDKGLTGLAVDPQYPADPYLYVLYALDDSPADDVAIPRWGDDCPTPPGWTTDGCPTLARLSRVTVDPTTGRAVTTNPERILITDWCSQSPGHASGTLA
jgi:hypothetical protein